jgi:uncharacterized protein YkwD
MRKTKILVLLSVLLAVALPTGDVRSATPSANDLIEAVNAMRADYKLSSIPTDSSLMSAAQTQADYLAETYDTNFPDNGHVGAGGTYARDRAIAAGYSLSSGMDVVENWAGRGGSATLSDVIYDTWSDDIHMANMLNKDAVAMGAGVSESAGGRFTMSWISVSSMAPEVAQARV